MASQLIDGLVETFRRRLEERLDEVAERSAPAGHTYIPSPYAAAAAGIVAAMRAADDFARELSEEEDFADAAAAARLIGRRLCHV